MLSCTHTAGPTSSDRGGLQRPLCAGLRSAHAGTLAITDEGRGAPGSAPGQDRARASELR